MSSCKTTKPVDDDNFEDILAKPTPEDCCGQGCNPCVFDIYERELKLLKKKNWETTTACSLNPENYSELKLMEIIPMTSDTNIYRFSLNGRLNREDICQHFLIRIMTDDRKYLIRPFTLLKIGESHLDFLIKLYKNGRFTQYVARDWKIDSLISMKGPFKGEFKYKRNGFPELILCAAGTGIAPMISFIDKILEDDEEESRITLHYSVISSEHVLCRDNLKYYADFWNFKLNLYASSQNLSSSSSPGIHCRRFNPSTDLNNLDYKNNLFFVCGTSNYEKSILSFLGSHSASHVIKF